MGRGPGVVTSIMANVLKYNQELVKQLSEVNFRHSEKATKIWPIFQILIDITW